MERPNNYLIQAAKAREYFLRYDQKKLIEKCRLKGDGDYLYTQMLCKPYRISRTTGDLFRWESSWVPAESHGEVMTLLDLICDSREDRFLRCKWKNMLSFGMQFHQNLLEDEKDPFASRIQQDMAGFERACMDMAGERLPMGDRCYAIELFDGLCIAIQFWEGDEEFSPRVRFLWDENALMYLKYETMYFAVGMLKARILETMAKKQA